MIRMGSLSVHFEGINTAVLSYRWRYGERHVPYALRRLQTNCWACARPEVGNIEVSGLLSIAAIMISKVRAFGWQKAPPTLAYARPRPRFFLAAIPFRPSPIFLAKAERTFA